MNFRKTGLFLIPAMLVNSLAINPATAEPVYHPSGPKLTFGGMTHRTMSVSDMGNPAHPATVPPAGDGSGSYSAGASIGLGIEYDGNDKLFELLDNLGSDDTLVPGGEGGDDGSGEIGGGDDGINIKEIIDNVTGNLTPEQQQQLDFLVEQISANAVGLAALLAVSVNDVNAKAFTSVDVPILISNNTLGGTWTFGANSSVISNLRGLNDPIEFDSEVALEEIKKAINLTPTDPVTVFDLTGGAFLAVDPATGQTRFRFENNSAVITKAAQVTEISIGYSRYIWQQQDRQLSLGIKPKFYNVGLINKAIPIANLDDAKAIFDALQNAQFSYSQDFTLDAGLIWQIKQFQFGATITNLIEPDFQYPEKDLTGITNPDIIAAIRADETYVMERQLKFDGGFITADGAWGLNFGFDANATPDPMGDDYQWVSIGAGYASDSWWLPGARLGLRKNIAGSELLYVTGGLTVFNIVNLDLATTTETININGTTVPRGLIANIGVQVAF